MLALTQCWYTRAHVPEGRGHREADGSLTGYCRHCGRPIIRRDGHSSWRPSDGIDLDELAEAASSRYLYLLDVTEDFIIARFPVAQLDGEEAIDAYKAQLREQHGTQLPGSTIVLKDSAEKGHERRRT